MECPGKAKNNKPKPPEKKVKKTRKPKAVKARS
jgi:hypothetical protein